MIPATVATFGLGTAELVIVSMILGLFLVISAIPAVLAYIVLSRVPPEHRKQSPGLVFLLLIPFFNLIWAFFVHPRVADSLKSYFDARGDYTVGDCGAKLALWTCIASIAAIIPLVGVFAGLASLVLFIIFYVKAFELSSRIARGM